MPAGRAARPVVVTGGAGAIGSTLTRALCEDGREVRIIDNLSSGRREALDGLVSSGAARLHVADVRDLDATVPIFRGAVEAWHLAANPDIQRGTLDPSLDLEHGTVAAQRFLEAARRTDVPELYFSSSSVVYGLPTVFPTPEDYGPLLPHSLYGASKLAGEALFSAYSECYGLRAHIFRFANIIGPGMTHGILVDLFAKLARDPRRLEVLGDGRQAKSYLRTDDCVAAMRFVGAKARERLTVHNLGARDRISVRAIAEKVVEAHGGRATIDFTGGERGWAGDIPTQQLSIDRIERLGWSPKLTSAEAIDLTIRELSHAARA